MVRPFEVLPPGDKYFSLIFRLVLPFTVREAQQGFERGTFEKCGIQ